MKSVRWQWERARGHWRCQKAEEEHILLILEPNSAVFIQCS